MSKRNRDLTHRLEELFSTPTEPEAKRPQPAEPEEVIAATAGPAHPDQALFAQAEASFVKTILDQLPMPIYVKDRDHKWVAVNPAFCRLIGKPADAVIGYTDKEQSDDDWQRDDQVFETGLTDEMQQALNPPDGSPFIRSIRRVPLKNAAGDVDYLVTIIEDAAQIHAAQESAAQETAIQAPVPPPATTQPAAAVKRTVELIKAEEALQQSESFYHSLVEVLPQCICRKDLEGRFTFANRLFCEDVGRPLADLIGKTDYDIHPPEMAEKYRRDDQHVVDAGQVFDIVEERAVLGGETAYVQTIKAPIRNAEGKTIGVQIMFWDVTERKRAEEALRHMHEELEVRVQERTAELAKTNVALQAELIARQQAEAATRESELRLNTAFDFSANGEALVSIDGKFMRVNRAWYELLGYTEEEMLQIRFRDITHPDDIESSTQSLRQMLAGELNSFEAEKRYLHKNGPIIWVQLSSALVRDSQGQPLYFISQIHDITGRKEVENRILRRNLELAAINRLSRELTHLAEPAQIIETINTTIGELIDNRNLYIALYDETNQQISFPLYTIDGERCPAGDRPVAHDMADYILRTKAPLLIPRNVAGEAQKLGIGSFGREAKCWLGAPLLAGDKAIGVITLQDYDQADVYTPDHVELLTTIAAQAAIALDNAQLFEEARIRAEELTVLNELGQVLNARLNVDQVLAQVYTGLSRLIDTPNFYIALYNPAAHTVSFPVNVTESVIDQQITIISADQGLTGYILRTRTSLLLKDDVSQWQKQMGMESVGQSAQSWLGVPMLTGSQIIGVMAIQNYETPNVYDEHDRDLLAAFANQTAIAIQNARLFEETQSARAETEQLYNIGMRINTAATLEDLLRAAIAPSIAAGCSSAGIWLFDLDETGKPIEMEFEAAWAREGKSPIRVGTRFRVADFPSSKLWLNATGQPSFIGDIARDERVDPIMRATFQQANIAATGFMPLLIGTRWIGLIIVSWPEPHDFSANEQRVYQSVASQVAVAIDNRRLLERIQHDADRARVITEIGNKLFAANDLPGVVRIASEELGRVLHVARVETTIGGDYLKTETEDFAAGQAAASGNGHKGEG
jgi:PAS domain S-box-containing protein